MEKKINPVLKRLSDFADSKGGFAEIGRKIQKHPSMFYNLVRRDALPSLATLTEIATAFPDLDMNYVIRGGEMKEAGQESEDKKELDRLRSELQRERAIVSHFVGKHKGVNISPDKKFRYLEAHKICGNRRDKKAPIKPMSVYTHGVTMPNFSSLI